MPFRRLDIKGIDSYWIEQGLEGEPLHLHISTTEPGTRAHPPHVHGGYEAFFLLEGEATLEFGDESWPCPPARRSSSIRIRCTVWSTVGPSPIATW